MSTPRLELAQLGASEQGGYVTYNELARQLQLQVTPTVVSELLTAPPGGPADGQCWYVSVGATGAWVGRDKHFAQWYNGGWYFTLPAHGTRFYISSIKQRAYIDENGDIVIISPPVTDYQDMVLADSPLAYYPFNARTGTTAEDIAGSANGTVVGGVQVGVPPIVQEGSAYRFTNGKVVVAVPTLGASWSFECWVSPSVLTGYQALFYFGSLTQAAYLKADKVIWIQNGEYPNNTLLTVDDDFHIVLSVSAGSATWYINGQPDGTFSGVTGGDVISIGSSPEDVDHLNADLDQVAWYSTALTAQQVLDHYNQGIGA